MKNPLLHIFGATAALFLATSASPAFDFASIECIKSAAFLAPADSPDHRKYAPDREVKISHLALEITPDFKQRTFEGKAVFAFKANGKPVEELSLDAVDLTIRDVTSTEAIQGWRSTADKLIITFAKPLLLDKEAKLTITYSAEPTKGIYFRTPEMGYKEGDTHLWSNGEPIEARHWYPCFDAPNAKFTTEMTCFLPDGMTAVSNGRLVSTNQDSATGLTAFHWSQEKPHANYLISLSAGFFKSIEEKHGDTPLAYLTPPSEIKEAAAFFKNTRDIMGFFEKETGVKFPWAKYDQICLNDFIWGGMENTSATLLTDEDLYSPATENIFDGDSLVAHEMAHQWFGDLVTCNDWSDIWLNEGFATYYALLYDEHHNGRDSMLYGLYQNARQIASMPNDTVAIVRHTYGDPNEEFGQYSYLPYPKGGWVLHMLRSQLGDDLYRRCITTYLNRHQYGNVVTEDLRRVIEELSGRGYDQFFDQWVYHAHHPELDAGYSWDERTKVAKVSIRQTQKIDENVLLFNFPLTVRFKGKFGTVDRPIQVKEKESDFEFTLDSAPEIIRLDPGLALLAKTTFKLPAGMLYAQLADKDDAIGRLVAIDQLGDKKDKETVAKLKQALNHDASYAVRQKAAQALRFIHTDDALEALIDSVKQSDARVRIQVVTTLGDFYRDTAYAALSDILKKEKNPAILADAIRGLGAYGKPEVHDLLIKYANSESFRNELAEAAVGAMNSQDDPTYLEPLMEALRKHEPDFRSRGFASGLRTVAYLARNEDKKDVEREFLLGYVNSKKQNVQIAAIGALGTLGDARAIAVLETFASAKLAPQQATAESAITRLRSGRKPVDDFKNLRQEVMDLEKANRELRKDFDELKKKAAKETATPAKPGSKNKAKTP